MLAAAVATVLGTVLLVAIFRICRQHTEVTMLIMALVLPGLLVGRLIYTANVTWGFRAYGAGMVVSELAALAGYVSGRRLPAIDQESELEEASRLD